MFSSGPRGEVSHFTKTWNKPPLLSEYVRIFWIHRCVGGLPPPKKALFNPALQLDPGKPYITMGLSPGTLGGSGEYGGLRGAVAKCCTKHFGCEGVEKGLGMLANGLTFTPQFWAILKNSHGGGEAQRLENKADWKKAAGQPHTPPVVFPEDPIKLRKLMSPPCPCRARTLNCSQNRKISKKGGNWGTKSPRLQRHRRAN